MKFAVCTYSVQIVGAIVGYLVLQYAMPQYAFAWYPAVPLLFMALSLPAVCVPRMAAGKTSAQTVNLIFGVKILKFVIAIAFFVFYIKVIGEQNRCFAVVFTLFYFITLATETPFLSNLLKTKHE
ncbi:MAG: hypothetical protein ACI30H_07125 [Paludibacteraceae bacterium]